MRPILLCFVACGGFALCSAPARAESPPQQKADDSDESIHVTVRGQKDQSTEVARRGWLESPRHDSTGEALTEIPGVAAVRRGAAAAEPVIRGAGWERVSTQVGHLSLFGACPGRMDPPVTYARPHSLQKLTLIKGLSSVTLGPAGTGGRVIVETEPQRMLPDGEVGGWLRSSFGSARRGATGSAGVHAGGRWLDAHGAFEVQRFGDYTSPDGISVPSNQREMGGSITLGFSPGQEHRTWHTLSYVRHDDTDYPALPMDLVSTDSWIYDGGYRIELNDPVLARAELGFGTARLNHVMSNENKPNRGTLVARTDSEVQAYAGHSSLVWKLGRAAVLDTGADASVAFRDAERIRLLVGPGRSFRDRLWPDASQRDLGAFAEARVDLVESVSLRVGTRVDQVTSTARSWNEPGLGGATVADGFQRFYGDGANRPARTEVVGGGNAVVTYRFIEGGTTYLGAGRTARTAGITERYFAFAPAPGGFQVGNPALAAEKKNELELGARYLHPILRAQASVYYHAVEDYILSTTIAQLDVDGDGTPDRIRGFRNVGARLFGGEVGLLPRIGDYFTIPLSFAAVRGDDISNNDPLPEIPPWEARVAVRATHHGMAVVWGQIGTRILGDQPRVNRAFGENETDGVAVFHIRVGTRIPSWGITIEGGVENLLNTSYHEHLTREAVLQVGDLRPGDEVPEPGRSGYVSARWDF